MVTVVEADYRVIEMQDGLGQGLTDNNRTRQLLHCPVQIVSEKASRACLERREIWAMLLWIVGEQGTKSLPGIAFKSLSVVARLPVRDHVCTERIACQI